MKRETLRGLFTLGAIVALSSTQSVSGSSIMPLTDEQLVKNADLIFQGIVTKIDYRTSGFRTTFDAQLPHTFVTFRVEGVLKGRYTGPSNLITLRLMGGPNSKLGRFFLVEGCPDFDVGERAIMFVRGNERGICPIAGWSQGRFRIVAGALYSDNGREVWLSPQGKLTLGPEHDLQEVRMHHRSATVFTQVVNGSRSSEAPTAPFAMKGVRLSPAGFLNYIVGLVRTVHTTAELMRLPAVKSAAIDQPFYVSELRAIGDK